MNLNDFPLFLSADDPIAASDELSQFRSANSDWVGQEAVVCDCENFVLQTNQSRYTIRHKDVPFECLFLPAKSRKLFVCLSGGGSPYAARRYPIFLRWKYAKYLGGNVLCIDDPMYFFHPEYSEVQWYYGTKDQSYLHLLVDVVKKFMEKLSVTAEDVVFMGSSGGGYSSIYCANLLDHSSAIAINPQSVLKEWHAPSVYDNFQRIGIDLAAEDVFGRNYLRITNDKSRFLLVYNVNSRKEYPEQFVPFFEAHGITPKYGITQQDNIVTWFHATDYSSPHSAVPTQPEFSLLTYILEKMKKKEDVNELRNLSFVFSETMYEKYEYKTQQETNQAENSTLFSFLLPMMHEICEETIRRFIPKEVTTNVRKLLEYQYDPRTQVIKNTNIGYYIGSQRIFRYNLFLNKSRLYFRMKFDKFEEYFPNHEEILAYIKENCPDKFDNCFFERKTTLVISRVLNPADVKRQIECFVEETIRILNAYLKIE